MVFKPAKNSHYLMHLNAFVLYLVEKNYLTDNLLNDEPVNICSWLFFFFFFGIIGKEKLYS
jgi:hypothetical protein